MNAKEFAKIAAAFAEDPASVQEKIPIGYWKLHKGSVLNSAREYRLTPKPREWWVVLNRDGEWAAASENRIIAQDIADRRAKGCYAPYTIVHVAEVLP